MEIFRRPTDAQRAPPRPRVGSWLLMAAIYFGAAKVGLSMAIVHPSVSAVWPASGVALAALLFGGLEMAPGVLLGAFLANLTIREESPGVAVSIALGNTLAVGLSAVLLQRFAGERGLFERPEGVLKFIAIAAVNGLLAAVPGTLSLCLGAAAQWSSFWPLLRTWWLGDAVGVLVMTPALLAWFRQDPAYRPPSLSVALLWGGLLGLELVELMGWLPGNFRHYSLSYLVLLPLLWLGLLGRMRMTTAALVVVMLLTVWGAQGGHGPFSGWSPAETQGQAQVFLLVCASATLMISAYGRERRLSEERSRSREAMLRAMVNNASEGVLIKDRAGRFLMINPAGAATMGRTPGEVEGLLDRDLIDPPTLRRIRELDERVAASGVLQHGEVEFSVGGQTRTFSVIKYPYRGLDGSVQGVIGSYRDVSERRLAERVLERDNALLKALFEASVEGILVVDEHRHVVGINRRFRELWDIPAELAVEFEDKNLLAYVEPKIVDAAGFMARVMYLYDHPSESSKEYIEFRDGRSLYRYTTPLLSPEGGHFGRVWFFWDITERKRLNQALQDQNERLLQLDRLKDLFLSSISHEMKTPLSLVTGYAELLEDKYPGEELVAGILDGSQRLAAHLTKILDYSALVSSSMPLYRTEVCLTELVDLVREVISENADYLGKTLRFETAIAPETPPICGDSRRLTQILCELLENAAKFTPPGGTIGVRIAPANGTVRLEVWDTGPGISPANLGHLGEIFSKIEGNAEVRTGGLGLGLSIVKKLAELHGGTMAIDSPPGQGTRVVVTLPVEECPNPGRTRGAGAS